MNLQEIQEPSAAPPADQRPFFRTHALTWTVLSLLAFLLVEAAVFRIGWYNQYLEPNSSAGEVEGYLSWLKRYPHGRTPEVLVMGDSRIAEGFSARLAGKIAQQRLRFWNFGIGGTTPRIWYYMLRDADPTSRRFKSIVIALGEYADEDKRDSSEDRVIDLNYLIGRLRLTDCPAFAASMKSADYKARALSGCLLKGTTLRRDVQELLHDRRDRVKRVKDYRRDGLFYVDDYPGLPDSLHGLTADFINRTIHFPAGVPAQRQGTVRDMVMAPLAPQTGELNRYRKLWLGKILDLYKDSPTRIIFLELPRAPIAKPESKYPPAFINWAVTQPRVTALPSSTFRDLEQPDLFFDGLHLNKNGRVLFSERLAANVSTALGLP
jgi:hypothetical protein